MKRFIFWARSSRSQMIFKIAVLKNFAIFTGKHFCWILFLIKLQGFKLILDTSFLQHFSSEWTIFCTISSNWKERILSSQYFLAIVWIQDYMKNSLSLRKKYLYLELFWSVFSSIRTEYGVILRVSPYSVGMRENMNQNNSEYEHLLHNVYIPVLTNLSQCFISIPLKHVTKPNVFWRF